jgi:hypothetical protein
MKDFNSYEKKYIPDGKQIKLDVSSANNSSIDFWEELRIENEKNKKKREAGERNKNKPCYE